MHWMGDWHVGMMWIWWLAAALLCLGVVWLVVRAGRGGAPHRDRSPEAILKRRYAAGEIGREEYERKLADLRQSEA